MISLICAFRNVERRTPFGSDKKMQSAHISKMRGKYLDVDEEHEAEEILHSILTSTAILTLNGKGEIVYRGHNIRGTDIVDLLKYCVTPYHPDIPEPNWSGYISQTSCRIGN
jgi:hypothetical protein